MIKEIIFRQHAHKDIEMRFSYSLHITQNTIRSYYIPNPWLLRTETLPTVQVYNLGAKVSLNRFSSWFTKKWKSHLYWSWTNFFFKPVLSLYGVIFVYDVTQSCSIYSSSFLYQMFQWKYKEASVSSLFNLLMNHWMSVVLENRN